MAAPFLDVLLDPADEDVLAVRDDLHIDLRRVGQIPVHQDRMRLRNADRPFHEPSKILLPMDDLHPSATEDIRRPDEDGIADPGSDLSDLFEAVTRRGLRLPDSKALHEAVELSTILGKVDGAPAPAENPRARTA